METVEFVSEAVTLLEALEAGTTDIYGIAAESCAVGRTLMEIDLRRQTGASVIAVVRGEQSHSNPSSDLRLEAGDCLVLVGSQQEVDRACQLLDGDAIT